MENTESIMVSITESIMVKMKTSIENRNFTGRIPKIIHYIWIGNNPKPPIIEKCLESWREFLPEYQIIEWNENNYDVNKNAYIQEAYAQKKYAYVSDYMRFDILFKYGGIYFDTDVELLKKIPDEVLAHKAFTGVESAGKVSPGLVYGCCTGDLIAKQMKESYENDRFDLKNLKTVNCRITELLSEKGFIENDSFQIVDGLAIYPAEVFCGFDQDVREIMITENTISVHHYAGTWKKKTLKSVIQKCIKRVLGVEGYRKLLNIKRKIKK